MTVLLMCLSVTKVSGFIPKVVRDEITTISHTAITDANKEALSYAILFGTIGLFSTIWLPNGTNADFEKNLVDKKKGLRKPSLQ